MTARGRGESVHIAWPAPEVYGQDGAGARRHQLVDESRIEIVRGRVDVAIHPDQPEGRWLLEYLVEKHIPYFAFRQAVPGKATGAHIHIGPLSTRYKLGG